MNKIELVAKVAENLEATKKNTTEMVDMIFDTIANTLIEGEEVSITGFGKFSVAERAARTARNPRTGETIEVGPSKSLKFKASSTLRTAVNE